jgi:hypothetical protein
MIGSPAGGKSKPSLLECFRQGAVLIRLSSAAHTFRSADNAERDAVRGCPQVGLLSVGLGDLADKLGPAHVHGPIDLAGLRSRIVLEDFHHQGRIVRDNDARL